MKLKMLPALAGDCLEIKFDGCTPGMVIIDGGMGKECRYILKNDVCDWKDKNGPVDLAILTHMDNDHISGFLSLIKDEKINDEYLSEMWFNYGEKIERSVSNEKKRLYVEDNSCLTSCKQGKELYEYLKIKNIPLVAPIISGMKKQADQWCLEVISPSEECLDEFVSSDEYQVIEDEVADLQTAARKNDYGYSVEDLLKRTFDESSVTKANASSVAVLVSDNDHSILCLGDAKSSEVERELRRRGYYENNPLHVDFVKVSHHGSSHSTSGSLIRILDCRNYLISTNWKGLPTKECLARIVENALEPVTFYCNYEPYTEIFTSDEYQKYGTQFKNIGNMEIDVSGESL